MKKTLLIYISSLIFIAGPLFINDLFADLPPDPGGDPTGGNPVGGGSPIGGGIFMLLGFAAIYGANKIIKRLKK